MRKRWVDTDLEFISGSKMLVHWVERSQTPPHYWNVSLHDCDRYSTQVFTFPLHVADSRKDISPLLTCACSFRAGGTSDSLHPRSSIQIFCYPYSFLITTSASAFQFGDYCLLYLFIYLFIYATSTRQSFTLHTFLTPFPNFFSHEIFKTKLQALLAQQYM